MILYSFFMLADCCCNFGKWIWTFFVLLFVRFRMCVETACECVHYMHEFINYIPSAQCDTGIALLAYMDGITGSPTLGGVVLATLSAAGYAVFKVCLPSPILHSMAPWGYALLMKPSIITGYVPQSHGRSASRSNCVHIHDARFY